MKCSSANIKTTAPKNPIPPVTIQIIGRLNLATRKAPTKPDNKRAAL
jgi:hypothetical protein